MQSVNLQIAPTGISPVINASQFDVGMPFQLVLYDGASAYNLPAGTTARVEGVKPDNHTFSYTDVVSVTNNVLTITTKEQMTVLAGDVKCEIRLSKSSTDIGTLNFILRVEESPINDNTDPSDTEIPAIIELAQNEVYESEAWANGTINGEPVPATAPQYHNNAKWWSDHAGGVNDMTGATSIADGDHGLVPKPLAGDQDKVLGGDATWKTVETTPTQNSKNPASSGALYSVNEALSNEVVTRSANGAHNLLPNTAGDKVDNGVTFTVNDNGSVAVSGTPGASPGYGLLTLSDNYTTELAGKTVICGGGSNVTDKCYINIECYNSSATRILDKNITTSEETFTIPEGTARIRCFLMVLTGFSGTSTLIYPMIRLASDADPTYQPYAKTNRELTERSSGVIILKDVLTFSSTEASQTYDLSAYKDDCIVIGTYTNNMATRLDNLPDMVKEIGFNKVDGVFKITRASASYWAGVKVTVILLRY